MTETRYAARVVLWEVIIDVPGSAQRRYRFDTEAEAYSASASFVAAFEDGAIPIVRRVMTLRRA